MNAPPSTPPAATNVSLLTKRFDELTTLELYRLLQLRTQVFVVEQNCVFQDMDEHDFRAVHIFTPARADAPMEGCIRVMRPGAPYAEASFGRVASALSSRRTGVGRALVAAALAWIDREAPGPVYIGAQSYLQRFYGGYDFVQDGAPYVEDGIPHVHMRRA